MRVGVPLFLIVILSVALGWVLWPDSSGEESRENAPSSLDDGEHPRAESEPGAVSSIPPSGIEEDSQEAGDREAVASGHRVRVLLPDGTAAADIELVAREVASERLEAMREAATQAQPAMLPGEARGPVWRTDTDGLVQLESLEPQLVIAWGADMLGHALIEETHEGPHELQLRAVNMIEVHVVEADGVPVFDRNWRLDTCVARNEELSASGADAGFRSWEYFQVWKWSSQRVGQLPDGRRVFVAEVTEADVESLGGEPGPYSFEMWLNGDGLQPQRVRFAPDEPGPIRFELDGHGEILLRVTGAPGGWEPTLYAAARELSLDGTKQEDGSWLFDRVPLDCQFEVRSIITSLDGRMRGLSRMSVAELGGPTVPGERVEIERSFAFPPGYVGRFIAPEGLTMDELFSEANRGIGRAEILVEMDETYHQPAVWGPAAIFPEGEFWVGSERASPPNAPKDSARGFRWQFYGSPRAMGESVDARDKVLLWAEARGPLPSEDAVVDLGEVPIHHGKTLLEVHVVDGQGEPIEGAGVAVAGRGQAERNGQAAPFQASYPFQIPTDADGIARIQHRDWQTGLQLMPSVQVESLDVTISHESATELKRTIPATQTRLDVVLASAGSIAGSVLEHRGIDLAYVSIVPPGTPWSRNAEVEGTEAAYAEFRHRPKPERAEWELKAVPAGTYDVVVRSSTAKRDELVRIPGVVVAAGEVTRDPRLNDIRLEGAVDLLELRFFDEEGRQMDRSDHDRFAPTIWVHASARGASGGDPTWVDGQAVFALPRGGTLDLSVSAEGWEWQPLGEVGGGVHEVRMRRARRATLVLEGWEPLPEGVSLDLSIRRPEGLLDRTRVRDVTGAEVATNLPSAGELSVSWTVRVGRSGRTVARSVLVVPESTPREGGRLTLPIPAEVLEELRQ